MSSTSVGPSVLLVTAVGVLVVAGLIMLVVFSWHRRSTKRTPVLFGALLVLMVILGGALTMVNLQRRASVERAYAHAQTQMAQSLARAEALSRHSSMHANAHPQSNVEERWIVASPPQMILDAGSEDGGSEDMTLSMTTETDRGCTGEEADTGMTQGIAEPLFPLCPEKDAADASGTRDERSCGWLGRFRPGSTASYAAHGGAFAVLLILGYLFLDAGRYGRYTWPLRFGTAGLFVGLCVMLR